MTLVEIISDAIDKVLVIIFLRHDGGGIVRAAKIRSKLKKIKGGEEVRDGDDIKNIEFVREAKIKIRKKGGKPGEGLIEFIEGASSTRHNSSGVKDREFNMAIGNEDAGQNGFMIKGIFRFKRRKTEWGNE